MFDQSEQQGENGVVASIVIGAWEGLRLASERGGDEQLLTPFHLRYEASEEIEENTSVGQLKINLASAGVMTSGLLTRIRQAGFHPISAMLRINDWENFEVMVTMPDVEIDSEQFTSIDDYVEKIDQAELESFALMFVLLSASEQSSEADLVAQGYVWRHKILA